MFLIFLKVSRLCILSKKLDFHKLVDWIGETGSARGWPQIKL